MQRTSEEKAKALRAADFGRRVAEEEGDLLQTYFVETDDWQKLYRGQVDVVYGPKGAGKSALYHLLSRREDELRGRGILIQTAENPRGATAFNNIISEPPVSEREFVGMWKLYFACLVQGVLAENEISNAPANELTKALADARLIKGSASLSALFSAVRRYVKRVFTPPKALEGTLELDPMTQMPSGVTGKIVFADAEDLSAANSFVSIDRLLELGDQALQKAGNNIWILVDRLDVAFAEHEDLEINAIRALFRVYLDLAAQERIRLKIFLRTDIWARITDGGFREASHITKHVTISWNRTSLLNLVVRRMLHNESICQFYGVDSDLAKQDIQQQEKFFYRVCPDQVDGGSERSKTFNWLLARTKDGSKNNAPRELIHMLNSLRDSQVRRFEMGEQPEPDGEQLFARAAFKAALPEVSKVRLEQTLYAEYPKLKPWLERLRGEKTAHSVDTLANVLGVSKSEATAIGADLVKVGFFELRGAKDQPEYWVPFLYRDGLEMVQGGAD